MCVYIYTYICIYNTHTYTCVYVQIFIYLYLHAYTCSQIIDYTLCSRVYRPKDSVIPVPLRDADAFEAAVHKKLDEVIRVYSSESAAGTAKSASCQQIVDDVEFVRSKFVANILAATARKVPKRQREWDSAVESNRCRTCLCCVCLRVGHS